MSGYIAICQDYLIDCCENSMDKCRRSHRSKSFIESKLKTQVESQQMIDKNEKHSENKSTQTSFQSADSSKILALKKQILELEIALHSKEAMIEDILADPVQFI